MAADLYDDHKTLAELADQAKEILDQVRRTGKPVAITRNGKPTAVLVDVDKFEWMVHLLNLNRLLNEGVSDILAGRTKPLDQVMTELGLGKKKARR